MSATRKAAFSSKGGAEILNLRIEGGFDQYPHSCPVSAGWLEFWTKYDSPGKLFHICFGLLILKIRLRGNEAFQLKFIFYPPPIIQFEMWGKRD